MRILILVSNPGGLSLKDTKIRIILNIKYRKKEPVSSIKAHNGIHKKLIIMRLQWASE
jgi:hypothetical protein